MVRLVFWITPCSGKVTWNDLPDAWLLVRLQKLQDSCRGIFREHKRNRTKYGFNRGILAVCLSQRLAKKEKKKFMICKATRWMGYPCVTFLLLYGKCARLRYCCNGKTAQWSNLVWPACTQSPITTRIRSCGTSPAAALMHHRMILPGHIDLNFLILHPPPYKIMCHLHLVHAQFFRLLSPQSAVASPARAWPLSGQLIHRLWHYKYLAFCLLFSFFFFIIINHITSITFKFIYTFTKKKNPKKL